MNLRGFWPWLRAELRWRVLGKRYEVILSEEAQNQLDELPEEAQARARLREELYGEKLQDVVIFHRENFVKNIFDLALCNNLIEYDQSSTPKVKVKK